MLHGFPIAVAGSGLRNPKLKSEAGCCIAQLRPVKA